MKGIKRVALVVILLLICVGAWFLLRPTPVTGPALAEMLPADTLIALELINLEESIEKFKTSRLGQKLKETDLNAVMQAFGTSAEQIETFNKGVGEIVSLINSTIFKELFGRDTVIALLPFNIRPEQEIETSLSSLVFVSRTKHRSGVVELLNMFISKQMQTQTHKIDESEVKGMEVEENIHVYYTFVDGLMISTFDLETMKTCLDLRRNNQVSLADNRHYQDLSSRLFTNDSTAFVFNNTKGLYENVVRNIPAFADDEDEKINEAIETFRGMEGFDAMAYSSYDNGGDMTWDRTLIVFDKSRMKPVYAKMYDFAPEENKTLGMTPENAMIYYWANSLDLSILREFYIEKLKLDEATLDDIETKFVAHTGVSFDEAVAAFGTQVSFLVTDIKTGGPFPIPVFGLLFQAENQSTIDKLISTSVQKSQMGLEEEQVDGITVKYVILPFGTDIQPAYAFYNGFCIVAINRQLLKKIINVDKTGGGIAGVQAFKDVNKGWPDKANGISYFKADVFLDKIQVLAEWGRNMSGMVNPQAAEKSTVLLNNLVNPVLDGLKMYKAFCARTEMRDNEIEVNSCLKIER